MKYREFLESVEKSTGTRPTHAHISKILGGKPTPNALSNRYFNNGNLSFLECKILENYFSNVKSEENLIREGIENLIGKDGVFAIPYWEGCVDCSDMLRRDDFKDLKIDIELINSWNVKPEDLRIIAMPGEDMDGGEMPIRNKDLLVIDTRRNNIAESGVFFCTTHGNSRVYVRRIIEKMTDDVFCVTTVDNLRYKSLIEKKWTEEMWKQADVQVIGRVITNATYTI